MSESVIPEPSAHSGGRGIDPEGGVATATSRLYKVLSVHLISLGICTCS